MPAARQALQMKGQVIMLLDKVWDLGVIRDSGQTLHDHDANVMCSSCQLQQLRTVCQSLAFDTRRTFAAALIVSRVDHCTALLHGDPAHVLQRFQMVMNAAACLVIGSGKFQHITAVICVVLHWIPVMQWIKCKTSMLTCDTGRSYFNNICIPLSAILHRGGMIQEPPVSVAEVYHFLFLTSRIRLSVVDIFVVDCKHADEACCENCLRADCELSW